MSEAVDELCDLLQNHANRDKLCALCLFYTSVDASADVISGCVHGRVEGVIWASVVVSLTCYVLKLWGARTQNKPLLQASARLAGARASLRLFDDAAALRVAINYGLGKQDGLFWGSLGISSSAFTLAYLQAEKLVWLLDTGLLTLSKDQDYKVRTAHKTFWVFMATVGFIRSIKSLHIAAQELKSPEARKCAPARFTQASLLATKLLLDIIHSVSWLPIGWLWGGRLSVEQMSSVATASAVLGLVTHYHGKRLASR